MATRSRQSSSSGIPQTAAAGGLLMTEPPQTAAPSFYKIFPNEPITFGWNLTSLYSTPAALTVHAWSPNAGNTYAVGPIGQNGVIPGAQTQIVWDLYEYDRQAAVPLVEGMYQLQIFDERGLGAGQAGGLFSPNTGLQFGIYRAKPPIALETYHCAACSAGTPSATIQSVPVALIATTAIMFISGWRVLRGAFAAR